MTRAFVLAVLILAACDSADKESSSTSMPATPATKGPIATATSAPAPELPALEGPKLLPVDESSLDPSLVTYLDALRADVRNRNVEAVLARVDPKIRTSFGDDSGSAALRRMLQKPETWADLERILDMGGTFLDGSERLAFWAPYIYSKWPEEHDSFNSVAVTTEKVPLRQSPDGPAFAMLSYDVLERVGDPRNGWQEVKTSSGATGYVETKYIRSPISYRAGFNKEGGIWKMTALVAGD